MRLIDADTLDKVKFHPLPYTHITPSDADAESYKRGWNDAIDAIMSEAPTIEERKTGHWINAYPDIEPNPMFMYGICSICGCEQSISNKLKFCPNCGAEMEDEE